MPLVLNSKEVVLTVGKWKYRFQRGSILLKILSQKALMIAAKFPATLRINQK